MECCDGWMPSNDVWVYASANSFTINGVDRTTVYTKGTRVKCTNNGNTFYGVVISSTFSTNTTVTLAANDDYSLANATITLPSYSYVANPQGYPGWFNYTPTWGGFSTNPNNIVARFNIIGSICHLVISNGGPGVSNATTFTVSLPANAAQSINVAGLINAFDNSSAVLNPGAARVVSAGDSFLTLYTSTAQAGWTASNGKATNFSLFYEI